MKKSELTKYETEIVDTLFESSAANGHDFGFVEDLRGPFNMRQARGAVSSLVKKNWITVHDAITNESGTWTQFTFTDEARAILNCDGDQEIAAPAEKWISINWRDLSPVQRMTAAQLFNDAAEDIIIGHETEAELLEEHVPFALDTIGFEGSTRLLIIPQAAGPASAIEAQADRLGILCAPVIMPENITLRLAVGSDAAALLIRAKYQTEVSR